MHAWSIFYRMIMHYKFVYLIEPNLIYTEGIRV